MDNRQLIVFLLGALLVFVVFFFATISVLTFFYPSDNGQQQALNNAYEQAVQYYEEGRFEEALEIFLLLEKEGIDLSDYIERIEEALKEEKVDLTFTDLIDKAKKASSFRGKVDIGIKAELEQEFNLFLVALIDYQEENFKGDVAGGFYLDEDYFELEGSFLFIDNETYIKISSLPEQVEIPLPLELIQDHWIKITLEDVIGLGVLSSEMLLLQETDLYQIEQISEGYYKVSFDLDSFINLAFSEEADREMIQEDLPRIEEEIVAHLWADDYLRRISFKNTIRPNIKDVSFDPEIEDQFISLSVDISFSQFNEEFEIIAPEEYKSFEDIGLE